MAREIKDTPVLSGKDAERFYYNLEHPKPVPQETKDRIRRMAEHIRTNGSVFEL